MNRIAFAALAFLVLVAPLAAQQTREDKVRADRKNVEEAGFWIYNDLARGFAEAKKTGKPLVVLMRCVPCAECVKLDDDLVNQDPRVRPLLEKYVRVRVVSTNGLDLSRFQFDTDQSFAAFLMNGDGAIYGRYGTRSHHSEWAHDVSIEAFGKALEVGLDIHKKYPANRAELAGKIGPAPTVPTPEKFAMLQGKYGPDIDFKGKVVQSCIHCHQIGDAMRFEYVDKKKPLPESLLFPFPNPKAIGLTLDPKECAKVLSVEHRSPADLAGFQKGDDIVTLEGQTPISIADVQWVLHHAKADGATLKAAVSRGGKAVELSLTLPAGWRRKDDIGWRVSSWQLRRQATGGMKIDPLTPEERAERKLPAGAMSLKVKHVGQYPPHNLAQKAGFRADDILVSWDGRTDLMRETDLLAYMVLDRPATDAVAVDLIRAGKKMTLKLGLQ